MNGATLTKVREGKKGVCDKKGDEFNSGHVESEDMQAEIITKKLDLEPRRKAK